MIGATAFRSQPYLYEITIQCFFNITMWVRTNELAPLGRWYYTVPFADIICDITYMISL